MKVVHRWGPLKYRVPRNSKGRGEAGPPFSGSCFARMVSYLRRVSSTQNSEGGGLLLLRTGVHVDNDVEDH